MILAKWDELAQARDPAAFAKNINGDFDRFVNGFLYSEIPDLQLFELAARAGRLLEEIRTQHKLRPLPAAGKAMPVTALHDFQAYLKKAKPSLVRGSVRSDSRDAKPILGRAENVAISRVFNSVIVAIGNVEINDCDCSVIIAGGDAKISSVHSSVVLVAGDLTLGLRGAVSGGNYLAAGGTIVIRTFLSTSLVVTPSKLDLQKGSYLHASTIVYEGKRKPSPQLFSFADLADYGLEATIEVGNVRVGKVTADSPFQKILKERDIVLAAKKTKVESVAHFRRLVSHAVDTGKLDLEVERDGQEVTIKADLKKKAR